MRYVIVTLALALIIFWIVRAVRGPGPDQQLPQNKGKAGRTPTPQVQDMVSCARCGLHLPKAEAIPGTNQREGAMYCCPEHLRLAES